MIDSDDPWENYSLSASSAWLVANVPENLKGYNRWAIKPTLYMTSKESNEFITPRLSSGGFPCVPLA